MKIKILSSLLFVYMFLLACTTTNKPEVSTDSGEEKEEHGQKTDWKEMDEFHTVMADSFHPYMDSKDLAPAKQHADQLAEVAHKWAGASLPEQVDNADMKSKLEKLDTSARAFAELAKSNNDAAIGDSLTSLHDLFHEIQDSWYHAGEKH